MSKKFEKIVNTPHRFFDDARKKLVRGKWPKVRANALDAVGKLRFIL